MRFFIRLLWAVSVLGTVVVLFRTYGNLALNFYFYPSESTSIHFSKNEYFFYALGAIVLSNLIFLLLHNSISGTPNAYLFVPARKFWTSSAFNRRCLNQIIQNWSLAFAATVNYMLCYFMMLVEHENHADGSKVEAVQWFYIPGLVMLLSMITPLVRLFLKTPNFLARTDQ
jgi:hypothetical protein